MVLIHSIHCRQIEFHDSFDLSFNATHHTYTLDLFGSCLAEIWGYGITTFTLLQCRYNNNGQRAGDVCQRVCAVQCTRSSKICRLLRAPAVCTTIIMIPILCHLYPISPCLPNEFANIRLELLRQITVLLAHSSCANKQLWYRIIGFHPKHEHSHYCSTLCKKHGEQHTFFGVSSSS